MVTVSISVAIAIVGMRVYLLWQQDVWNLPNVVNQAAPLQPTRAKPEMSARPLPGTETIVSKNLFDPERGAGQVREAEAETRAAQRVRSLVLLGTAILGPNQYAILQEPTPGGGPPPPGRAAGPLRFKLGDVFEGFNLSEIRDKNVVFSKGASKVELALDYFRKSETPVFSRAPVQRGVSGAGPAQAAPVTPLVPRVVPQLPRRERVPAPPNP